MLLTDTIKNCTTAITTRRMTLENKQNAEVYTRALAQLAKQNNVIVACIACAKEMKDKGIISSPALSKSVRDDLLSSVGECGSAIHEGTLTIDAVKLLQSKGEAAVTQVKNVWKESATKYAQGTKGYLSMISGLSQDPRKARELGESITRTVEGVVSIANINKLVADVKEAKTITDSFSLSPEIEVFLRKVSSRQATVSDITPEILNWLNKKNLNSKLRITF